MLECILNRVLVQLEEVKSTHKVAGTDIEIAISYGEGARRVAASVDSGVVIAVGPDAYTDYGYTDTKPVSIGDKVQFAKYAGREIYDPDEPTKRVAVLNDEDILVIIKSKENTNE